MSLSFGTTLLSILFLSPSAASLPTATRRTRSSPVRVRLNRCLADLLGVHTASGVYTSSPYLRTHACIPVCSYSSNSSHSSRKMVRFENSKQSRSSVGTSIEKWIIYTNIVSSRSRWFSSSCWWKNPLRTYRHSSTKLRINVRLENLCVE